MVEATGEPEGLRDLCGGEASVGGEQDGDRRDVVRPGLQPERTSQGLSVLPWTPRPSSPSSAPASSPAALPPNSRLPRTIAPRPPAQHRAKGTHPQTPPSSSPFSQIGWKVC